MRSGVLIILEEGRPTGSGQAVRDGGRTHAQASRELCALLPVLVSQPAYKRRYPCSLDVSGAHAVHGSRPFHTGSSRASGWGRWTVDIEHGERERCLVDVKFMAARAPICLRVVSRPIYEPWGGTLLRRPSGSWVRPPWP